MPELTRLLVALVTAGWVSFCSSCTSRTSSSRSSQDGASRSSLATLRFCSFSPSIFAPPPGLLGPAPGDINRAKVNKQAVMPQVASITMHFTIAIKLFTKDRVDMQDIMQAFTLPCLN